MKTLTFQEYRELTPRTLPRLDHHTTGYRLLDNLHMIIGMATEIGEMMENQLFGRDIINIGEEFGDHAWYLANYMNINSKLPLEYLDFKFSNNNLPVWLKDGNTMVEVTKLSTYNPRLVLAIATLQLMDLHKKELAYGEKKLITSKDRNEAILAVFNALNNCFAAVQLNPGEWLYKNIAKLIARYPDNFSEESAVVRDLKKELNILEG